VDLLITIFLFSFIFIFFDDAKYHKEVTKKNDWHKGSFTEVKHHLINKDWYYDNRFEESIFTEGGDKIHAGKIKINGEGIVLGVIDYYKTIKYVKNFIKDGEYVYLQSAAHVKRRIHHSITKDGCKVWGEGTFDVFLKEYNKRDWELTPPFDESLFAADDSQLHASIISFGGIGMLLDTEDYKKAREFVKKEIREGNYESRIN
jgi:hypothetical protein